MAFVFAVTNTRSPAPEPVAGLRYTSDTTPLTRAMIDFPSVIDGERYVQATSRNWTKTDSYGFDLGSSQAIWGIDVWCTHLQVDTDQWYGAAATYGKVGIYKSNDNATYTLHGEYLQPTVFSHADNSFAFRIAFVGKQTARYWKIRNNGTSFFGVGSGNILKPAELEVYAPAG